MEAMKDIREIKGAVRKALAGAGYAELGAQEKAVDNDALVAGDGLVHPEQRDLYYQYLRAPRPSILPAMRFERVDRDRLDLDKIGVGQPVTDWPDDDLNDTETSNVLIGGTVNIACEKARVSTRLTYRSFRRNIEGQAILDTVAGMTAARGRYDLELAAMRGDTDISGSDRVSKLLKKMDGILKQCESSKVVSAAGGNLDESYFDEAFMALPDEAKNDPDLAWVMSPNARVVWNKIMRNKIGANADLAQQGAYRVGPHGFKLIETPAIPSNLAVTVSGGSPGFARSAEPGQYRITSSTKNLRLNIASVGLTSDIDVSGGKADGKWTALQVAARINAFLVADNSYGAAYANVASADSEGHLTLTAPANNQAVIVTAGSSASALAALGLTAATYSGASSGGTSHKGSQILLCNPMNFVFAMVDQIRAYTKFFPEKDYFGIYQYQEVDFKVEDPDKVVKIKNFLCQ